MFNITHFHYYFPEILIITTIILQIIFLTFNTETLKRISNIITCIGLGITLGYECASPVFPSMLYINFFKILTLVSSIIILVFSTKRIFIKNIIRYNILFLSAILFCFMVINCKNYLSLYVNLELLSIIIYLLLSYEKTKISYSETIKYLISSVISSSFLILGIAFIYGLTNSIEFTYIKYVLENNENFSFTTYIIPIFLIFTGLFFKLGIFPFQKWVVDIYKNIELKNVALISVIPKIALFAILIKVIGSIQCFETSLIIILLGLISCFYGAVYGLKSKKLREIMACSSYVSISYMLILLGLYTKISISAMMFYQLTYIFMNLGAFLGIGLLERSNISYNREIKGYFYKNPIFSTFFAICIISLLGFPLTSGFIAKLYMFSAIINSGILTIPLILVLFGVTIISIVFYITVIRNMFIPLKYSEYTKIKTETCNKIPLYLCSLITILLGILPSEIISICETISRYI